MRVSATSRVSNQHLQEEYRGGSAYSPPIFLQTLHKAQATTWRITTTKHPRKPEKPSNLDSQK